MVAAPVAGETGGGLERVDHEAVARARGEHGEFLGAWAARRGVGHLGPDVGGLGGHEDCLVVVVVVGGSFEGVVVC